MADSIAKRILTAVATRLSAITVAGGYHTDAGKRIYMGMPSFDSEDDTFPLLAVFSREEPPQALTGQRSRNTLTVLVNGFLLADNDATNKAHDTLADVKKAVLLAADSTLGGLAHHLAYLGSEQRLPEDGSTVVALEIRFDATYDENYGDPYTVL